MVHVIAADQPGDRTVFTRCAAAVERTTIGISRRRTGSLLFAWLLACCGCSRDAGGPAANIEVENPKRVSPPLLASEVQQADDPARLLDSEFSLLNRTSIPQSVTLVGKSCACYGVFIDGQSWGTGSLVTINPQVPRRLRFDVKPPQTAGEKSWTVRLATGPDGGSEQVITLGVRVYDDVRLEPEALFTGRLRKPASSDRTTPPAHANRSAGGANGERLRLLVRRTWRATSPSAAPPQITGLPRWIHVGTPRAVNDPTEVAEGLWQQSWEFELEILPGSLGVEDPMVGEIPEVGVTGGGPSQAHNATGADHEVVQSMAGAGSVREGVYRFGVEFPGEGSTPVRGMGRLVVESLPGVRGPSVVHWGQLAIADTRRRRIVLSSGDGRAFQVAGLKLVEEGSRQREHGGPTGQVAAAAVRESTGSHALEVELPQAKLIVSVDRGEAGSRHNLALEIVARQAGPLSATLIVVTDHPLTPELSIGVRAIVTDRVTGKGRPELSSEG